MGIFWLCFAIAIVIAISFAAYMIQSSRRENRVISAQAERNGRLRRSGRRGGSDDGVA